MEQSRRKYRRGPLDESQLDADPFVQFEQWFEEACEHIKVEPSAMTLTTVGPDGAPAARTVLLKLFDHDGFVFYTNYGSRKAQHIESNPRVSLLFWWPTLERQVEVSGVAERVSSAQSAKYFATRPRGSQLGAWVSRQSEVLTSRKALEKALAEIKSRFAEGEVPLPSFWGGYRVVPSKFELWQGQPDRLHDRFQYLRDGQTWKIQRLAP